MTEKTPAVSVIGLGAMGSALAGALLSAGHRTTVFNRTAARAAALVARGAHRADSAAAAIAASELTIVCLLDDDAARAVLEPASGTLDGRVLLNLTSGAPAGARAWETWAAERGASYLDGGIVALPEAVGSDDALVLLAGDEAVFRRVEPAVAALGRAIWLGREAGLAAAYDMALQSGMYGIYASASHAVALVDSAGGDAAAFARDLFVPWTEGMLAFLVGAANPQGDVPEDFNPALQAVALGRLIAATEEQGVDGELSGHLRASLHLMRRAARAA